MAKYIIDLPDNTQWVEWVKTNGRTASMDFLNVEDLEVYEEPDLEGVLGEAFDDGYDVGLTDSWDAARKIMHGELWVNAGKESGWTCARDVIDSVTAKEAMEMLKEQEASRGVRAGDVVCDSSGDIIGVVIGREEDGEDYAVMDKEGRVCSYPRCEFAKTDKRFPEIEAVLSGIRGMAND